MSEVDFPFKTGAGYTIGSNIWSSGNIKEPGASDGVQAELIRRSIERLSQLVFFVGSGGVSDVYIIGNGTPPAGGYTPTTRDIKINGPYGFTFDGAPFKRTGDGAKTTGRAEEAVDPTEAGAIPIDGTADIWTSTGTLIDQFLYVQHASAEEGDEIEVAAYDVDAAGSVEVRRQSDSSTIVRIDGPGWGGVKLRFMGGRWAVTQFSAEHPIYGTMR